MSYNLLAISGSLRKGSHNTNLIHAFKQLAPEGVAIEIADLSPIGLYNQDEEGSYPQVVADLKEKIKSADGIIISTPEYNRSIPGVLKNAIDWTSRPYGQTAWAGKPVFVASASIGPISGALAQYDVKKIMLYLNTYVLPQPEFFLGSAGSKFNEQGELTDEDTKKLIVGALDTFTKFIDTVK